MIAGKLSFSDEIVIIKVFCAAMRPSSAKVRMVAYAHQYATYFNIYYTLILTYNRYYTLEQMLKISQQSKLIDW